MTPEYERLVHGRKIPLPMLRDFHLDPTATGHLIAQELAVAGESPTLEALHDGQAAAGNLVGLLPARDRQGRPGPGPADEDTSVLDRAG
jgi:hypothetical protein